MKVRMSFDKTHMIKETDDWIFRYIWELRVGWNEKNRDYTDHNIVNIGENTKFCKLIKIYCP